MLHFIHSYIYNRLAVVLFISIFLRRQSMNQWFRDDDDETDEISIDSLNECIGVCWSSEFARV